jgi:hypothetical protein
MGSVGKRLDEGTPFREQCQGEINFRPLGCLRAWDSAERSIAMGGWFSRENAALGGQTWPEFTARTENGTHGAGFARSFPADLVGYLA